MAAHPMTEQEWRQFITDGTRTGMVATVRADGRPHVAPVWFDLDGDDIVFMTGSTSVKGKSLVRDPRVSISVDDPHPPFSFVTIQGTATISEDLDDLLTWGTRLGGRYMGAEAAEDYGKRNAAPGELLVRVRIEKVVAIADLTH
ncbi:PPOX class F420-dependent oxidoreductase [Fodinicola feengrottensis]|nr:PPOX class F420-dependent oxidoreductase [Fodinicola feengrottensis]